MCLGQTNESSVMCWRYGTLDKSLKFFTEQGFETFGAVYYDSADLKSSQEWLRALEKYGSEGIMYTTWEKKYELLSDFGEMVR